MASFYDLFYDLCFYSFQRHRVQAVTLNPATSAIASADESGNVVVWNAEINARKKHFFGKNSFFAAKWAMGKGREHILALGGRQGKF